MIYKTKTDLQLAIESLLPHASIEVDLNGQLVIYTDLHVVKGSDVLQSNAISYEVIVGNIGMVYSGYDEKKAMEFLISYRDDPPGRATGEVVLLANGEIEAQYAY
jgi:hypothetical protein